MRLWFLGVRGSTPAPGPDFVRYGGHTSCVACAPDDADEPTVVLDAGTGLRQLSALVRGVAFRGAIVLTHLHWDHVQGLPFFTKGDHPESDVEVYLPAQDGMSGRDLMARLLTPPLFPILPEGLQGRWRFHTVDRAAFEVGGLRVEPFDVEHKGGRTLGFRIDDGVASVAFVPDHAAVSRPISLVKHLSGVDLLIHDSQFVDAEREMAARFGHATVTDTIELALQAGAKAAVLFHHGPARTDEQLDEIGRQAISPIPLSVAREGMHLRVGSRD